jgi:hypothetical protein
MAQYRATAWSLTAPIEKAHRSKDIPPYSDLYSNELPRCVHVGFEILSVIGYVASATDSLFLLQ